ncbi:unnamed protein product [Auanema sp. JU1783]|nr:unnamed protein product [Auanema sp. JU1783]
MVQSMMKHQLIKSCSGGLLPSSTLRKFENDCNSDSMVGEVMTFKERSLVIQKKIATGSFSKIYKGAVSIKSPGFALKFLLNKSTKDKKRVALEMEAIRNISKKPSYRNHFPRFISVTSFNDFKCIIMERMNTNLRFYMASNRRRLFKLKDIRQISKQLLSAIVYLHNMEYIHTNIKPENIMIVDVKTSPIQIKLCGFGHSMTTSSALSSTGKQIQPLHYRSPEILFGLPFCDSIDIWSIGCILAELYIGSVLYSGKTEAQMVKYIAETQGFPSHLEQSKYWSHYVVPADSVDFHYQTLTMTINV